MNMKKILQTITIAATLFTASHSLKAQTQAMDFNVIDCNGGGPHHLYADLNAGKVVIIEYFMLSCSPCVVAGNALEATADTVLSGQQGKVDAPNTQSSVKFIILH